MFLKIRERRKWYQEVQRVPTRVDFVRVRKVYFVEGMKIWKLESDMENSLP